MLVLQLAAFFVETGARVALSPGSEISCSGANGLRWQLDIVRDRFQLHAPAMCELRVEGNSAVARLAVAPLDGGIIIAPVVDVGVVHAFESAMLKLG